MQNFIRKSAALLLAMLAFTSFAACGSVLSDDNSGGEESKTSVSADGVSDQETIAEKDPPSKEEIVFEEITVVDNDECLIKITGIDSDSIWGYSLKMNLENKSSDKTYMFSLRDASINGVQTMPLFASEVAAGKKSNDSITFSDSDLSENGIVDYTDIELSFRVYDRDDFMADAVAEETVHVYPFGKDKASVYTREPQSDDRVLIDNEYVSVTVTGYENDSIWGYTVKLFLVNKSDTDIMFSVDEASVNGYMADPFFAKAVSAGKCAFASMSWSNSVLEDNGISDVEEIEFVFRAYDDSDWFADDLANENIILNP